MVCNIKALPFIVACALLGATEASATTCTAAPSSCTPFVVTIEQVGPNVVATGSGEFDLTGLSFSGSLTSIASQIQPGNNFIIFDGGVNAADFYLGTFSGPTNNLGSGGTAFASSDNNGPVVGFAAEPVFAGDDVEVPSGYASGTLLSTAQDIFDNTTLAKLEINPGIYKWTWGTAADQSFTVDVGAVAVPLPGTLPLFAGGLGALGLLHWRRKRKAHA